MSEENKGGLGAYDLGKVATAGAMVAAANPTWLIPTAIAANVMNSKRVQEAKEDVKKSQEGFVKRWFPKSDKVFDDPYIGTLLKIHQNVMGLTGAGLGLAVGGTTILATKAEYALRRKLVRADQFLMNDMAFGSTDLYDDVFISGISMGAFSNQRFNSLGQQSGIRTNYATALQLPFSQFAPATRGPDSVYQSFIDQITSAPDQAAKIAELAQQWFLEQVRFSLNDEKAFKALTSAIIDKKGPGAGGNEFLRYQAMLRRTIDRFLDIFEGAVNHPIVLRSNIDSLSAPLRRFARDIDVAISPSADKFKKSGGRYPVDFEMQVYTPLRSGKQRVVLADDIWDFGGGRVVDFDLAKRQLGLNDLSVPAADMPAQYFLANVWPFVRANANLIAGIPGLNHYPQAYQDVILDQLRGLIFQMFMYEVDPAGALNTRYLGEVEGKQLNTPAQTRNEKLDALTKATENKKAAELPTYLFPQKVAKAYQDLASILSTAKIESGTQINENQISLVLAAIEAPLAISKKGARGTNYEQESSVDLTTLSEKLPAILVKLDNVSRIHEALSAAKDPRYEAITKKKVTETLAIYRNLVSLIYERAVKESDESALVKSILSNRLATLSRFANGPRVWAGEFHAADPGQEANIVAWIDANVVDEQLKEMLFKIVYLNDVTHALIRPTEVPKINDKITKFSDDFLAIQNDYIPSLATTSAAATNATAINTVNGNVDKAHRELRVVLELVQKYKTAKAGFFAAYPALDRRIVRLEGDINRIDTYIETLRK